MREPLDLEPGPGGLIEHDIRNALACIKAYSHMLADRVADQDDETRKIVSGIKRCGDRVAVMLECLLDVSGGTYNAVKRESVDVVELVFGMAESFAAQAAAHGVSVTVEVAPRMPKLALNRLLVERAVANLIDNAIKYNRTGGHVTVRVYRRGQAGEGHVAICVEDDGPGIAADERDRVFERFYRSPGTSHIKGHGLGLLVVKVAADAHGGFVELVSEPGRGSEFSLVLPVSEAAQDCKY